MADQIQFNGKTYVPIATAAEMTGSNEAVIMAKAHAGVVFMRAIGKKIYVDIDGLRGALGGAPGAQVPAPSKPAFEIHAMEVMPQQLRADAMPPMPRPASAPVAPVPAAAPTAPVVPLAPATPEPARAASSSPAPAVPPIPTPVIIAPAPHAVVERSAVLPNMPPMRMAPQAPKAPATAPALPAVDALPPEIRPLPRMAVSPMQLAASRRMSALTAVAAAAAIMLFIGSGMLAYGQAPRIARLTSGIASQLAAVVNFGSVEYQAPAQGNQAGTNSPSDVVAANIAATIPAATSTPQPIYYVYNYPVIERVREEVRYISATSTDSYTAQLNDLYNRIEQQIAELSARSGTQIAQTYQVVAQSQRIDQLSGTHLDRPVIVGGSISGVSLNVADLSAAVGVDKGGTGTSTAPSYGKLLVGNAAGGYDLIATSSLGIVSSGGTSNVSTSTANTWSALQQFAAGASTTQFSIFNKAYFGGTATSTFDGAGNLTLAVTGNSLLSTDSTGKVVATSSISTGLLSANTISGVSLGGTLGALSAANGTLTFSGSYDGSAARTVGLNLSNANTWSAFQLFAAGASTTNASVFGSLWVGGSATTTILGSATSTFGAGIQATALNLTGTATSTAANGFNIASGCFAVNGTCLTTGGSNNVSTSTANTWSALQQFAAGASTTQFSIFNKAYFGGTATSTFDTLGNLTLVNNGLNVGSGQLTVSSGNVGIGTSTPFRSLSVAAATNGAQVAVSYDTTRNTDLLTDSAGDLNISPSGGDIRENDGNLWVCSGGSCPSGAPSGTGNLVVENAIGIGTSSPQGSFAVVSTGGSDAASPKFFTTDTNYAQIMLGSAMAGYKAAMIRYINGNGTAASARLSLMNYGDGEAISIVGGGKVGVGTTTPTDALSVQGLLRVGANSDVPVTLGTATSTFNGDIKILGKLDVGTIDPVYTIGGIKYATYGASQVGVKEEVSLKVVPKSLDQKSGMYVYTIDFPKLEKGSDLWLFYQITDFGSTWENLVVTLAPEFDGRAFYMPDITNHALRIFASKSEPVSVRLVANRFDFSKWPNLRADQDGNTEGTHVLPLKTQ